MVLQGCLTYIMYVLSPPPPCPLGLSATWSAVHTFQRYHPSVRVTIIRALELVLHLKYNWKISSSKEYLYCTVMLLLRIRFKKYIDTTHNPIGVLCCRALKRDGQRWRLILCPPTPAPPPLLAAILALRARHLTFSYTDIHIHVQLHTYAGATVNS